MLLVEMIDMFGEDWETIGVNLGIAPRACHDHYRRTMKVINRAPWTKDEERRLREYVADIGPRWQFIAEGLGTNRSQADVRNRWTKIKDLPETPVENIAPPSLSPREAELDDEFFHFPDDL
jgi:hypothetical protein